MASETENIIISFQKRCVSELTSDTVIFETQDARTKSLSSYHRCHYLGIDPRPARSGQRDERHLFQVSNFAKTGTGAESTFKVWQMFDDVYAAFDKVTFDLKNWAGDDSKIADIQCFEVEGQIINENNPEMTHLACTFTGLVIF